MTFQIVPFPYILHTFIIVILTFSKTFFISKISLITYHHPQKKIKKEKEKDQNSESQNSLDNKNGKENLVKKIASFPGTPLPKMHIVYKTEVLFRT